MMRKIAERYGCGSSAQEMTTIHPSPPSYSKGSTTAGLACLRRGPVEIRTVISATLFLGGTLGIVALVEILAPLATMKRHSRLHRGPISEFI